MAAHNSKSTPNGSNTVHSGGSYFHWLAWVRPCARSQSIAYNQKDMILSWARLRSQAQPPKPGVLFTPFTKHVLRVGGEGFSSEPPVNYCQKKRKWKQERQKLGCMVMAGMWHEFSDTAIEFTWLFISHLLIGVHNQASEGCQMGRNPNSKCVLPAWSDDEGMKEWMNEHTVAASPSLVQWKEHDNKNTKLSSCPGPGASTITMALTSGLTKLIGDDKKENSFQCKACQGKNKCTKGSRNITERCLGLHFQGENWGCKDE